MLDHGPHPPRSREKKRNPWRQHVHRATRPRSYAIDKVWEAVTSRCLGNGLSDGSWKQYGGVKSIICYLCFMQHAWSCYFFFNLSTINWVNTTICDSVNHTRFPKEKHLPYWARRGNKDKKGDRVEARQRHFLSGNLKIGQFVQVHGKRVC